MPDIKGSIFNLGQARPFMIRTMSQDDALKEGFIPSRSIIGVLEQNSYTGMVLVDTLPPEGNANTIYIINDGRMYMWRTETKVWQQVGGGGGGSITLYSTTGQNTDGAMTQKATTDNLDLKVNEKDFITDGRIDEILGF